MRHQTLRILFNRPQILTLLIAGILFLQAFPLLARQATADRDDALERARAAALARQYDDALEIFGELAQRNPSDLEVKNWIARIESWKGNYEQAARTYRGVLREAPGNLEAELGLADVLLWQGRQRDAEELLRRITDQQPANTEALLRLGKLSQRQRRRREALEYFRQVLAIEPDNLEAKHAAEAVMAQKPFRLEMGYFREALNFASDTNGNFLGLSYRKSDRTTLLGRFEYQNKFAENDTRFTLGATVRVGARTWLATEASLAPRSNTVIANQSYSIEATERVLPGLAFGTGYGFLLFHDAEVNVWSGMAHWQPRSNIHVDFRYTPSRTRFELASRPAWNQSGSLRLAWDSSRVASPYLLLAVGNESFSTLSADKLGRFAAHSYGGGVELRITRTLGLRFGYHLQKRTQDRREQAFEISQFFDF